MGLPPLEAPDTLLPTAETTGYELPGATVTDQVGRRPNSGEHLW